MSDEVTDPDELPSAAGEFAREVPQVWENYEELGRACAEAGPLDDETKRLVKLAIAIGSQSEGAVHSHARRALDEDVAPEVLKQVGILAITTIGFPKAMAALTWMDDITEVFDS